MASIRKRGDFQWEARVRKRGQPVQCKTFTTRAKAESWSKQIESEMDRGVFVSRAEAENTTLAEALDRYVREVLPTKKSARSAAYHAHNVRKALGTLSLSAITSSALAKYRDRQLAEGYAAQTVKHDLSLVSRVLNICIKEWGIALPAGNPVAQVKMPSLPPGRDRRLVDDELPRLLAAAHTYGGEIGPIITWAIETAMRRGEIAAMRWEHLDRKARVLLIPETKNGTPRRVPLSTAALVVLDGLPRRIDGRVFAMHTGSISRAFAEACKAAGIEGLTFHDLRHEATSRLFEKGLNPMQVAAITGHKTLQMLKRYTHLRAEDLVGMLG